LPDFNIPGKKTFDPLDDREVAGLSGADKIKLVIRV